MTATREPAAEPGTSVHGSAGKERRGFWSSFQYVLRERLVASGARVDPDGKVS